MEMDERKDGAFRRWLLEKDERFYLLFLAITFIFFTALSLINLALIAGGIIAGMWIIFYFAIIRKS
jgi:hypothetical protein